MGPFAESMGLSTGMAMWIAVAQLPVAMGLALHYPTVRIDMYNTAPRVVFDQIRAGENNSTTDHIIVSAVAASNSSAVQVGVRSFFRIDWRESAKSHGLTCTVLQITNYDHGIGITGLYVLNAASITFFAVLCMNLLDRGMHSAMVVAAATGDTAQQMGSEEFVSQNVKMIVDPTFRMWNQVLSDLSCTQTSALDSLFFRANAQAFTALLLVTHSTFVATVCSPLSWDVLSTYVLLTYMSLVSLVQPQDNFYCESMREAFENEDGAAAAAGMMASISSQTIMGKSIAYMLAVGYVMLHVWVDAGACKAQLLLLLACLDSLLLYGHLWDRVPNLQVVLNCRFIYACLLAVLNLGAFVLWSRCLATPFAK